MELVVFRLCTEVLNMHAVFASAISIVAIGHASIREGVVVFHQSSPRSGPNQSSVLSSASMLGFAYPQVRLASRGN